MRIRIYSQVDPQPHRSRGRRWLEDWGNLALYAVALATLLSTRIWPVHAAVMLLPLLAFFFYDLWFVSSDGDDGAQALPEELVRQMQTAGTATHPLLGLIGVVLSVMISTEMGQRALLLFRDPMLACYGVVVLAGAATVLLFIPVKPDPLERTPMALRSCFFIVMFLQKTVVLLVVYLLLELLAGVVAGCPRDHAESLGLFVGERCRRAP